MASQSITVGVRVRPFSSREIKHGSACIVDMQANATYLKIVRQGKVVAEKPREFVFDHAFWTHAAASPSDGPPTRRPFADQAHVYDSIGRPVLDNAFEGFNSCLLAYGQTGSGKTYSMMGTKSDPGVLPRLGTELFARAAANLATGEVATSVQCYMCEIYNDVLRDLLLAETEERPALSIRHHATLGVTVQGVTSVKITDTEQFLALLEEGNQNRATAMTLMNNSSSRSHAIVMLTVTQVDKAGLEKTSRISLVDLAGSERLESTGSTGSTQVEGQHINLSLSTLGQCLSRLADVAEGRAKTAHIPYRDSSLTDLLRDNLGGNSKTAMLAALSPADLNYEETLSTLRFASVTKRVKTVAVINERAQDRLIRELREELAALRQKLATMQAEAPESKEALSDLQNQAECVSSFFVTPQSPRMHRAASINCRLSASDSGTGTGSSAINDSGAAVFVDWRAPQLINMNPDAAASAAFLALAINEGSNNFTIDGRCFTVDFDALQQEVHLRGEDIYRNGDQVRDEGVLLRPSDRVVVGSTAFRFAFAGGRDADYDPDPKSGEHCELLERLERAEIVNQRSTDAMSIAFAFFSGLADGSNGGSGGDSGARNSGLDSPRAYAGTTPRTRNPVARLISDDISMTNATIFRVENTLSELFPRPLAELQKEVTTCAYTYDQAIQEKREAVEAQAAAVTDLRRQLAAQLDVRRHLEKEEEDLSVTMRVSHEEQWRLQAACADRALENELVFHSKVKALRHFRPDGPTDPTAQQHWATFSSNPPFLSDPALLLEPGRQAVVGVFDPNGEKLWKSRFLTASKTFLYFYYKNDGRERLWTAVYLPGCQVVVLPSDPGVSPGATNKFTVELLPACPRTPTSGGISAATCALRVAFATELEGREWHQWIESVSTPPMPITLLTRWTAQHVARDENLRTPPPSTGAMSATAPSEPTQRRLSAAAVPADAKARSQWKADESAKYCFGCHSKFHFFRRRHHCRQCGEIFCADCIGSDKQCTPCRMTTVYDVSAALSNYVDLGGYQRQMRTIAASTIKHHERLRQTFRCRIGMKDDNIHDFRVDHYQFRANNWIGDDILSVERCVQQHTRLFVHLSDDSTTTLLFDDALQREQCLESLVVLQGRRVYVGGLPGLSEETDYIVTDDSPHAINNEESGATDARDAPPQRETCLLRATNVVTRDATVWAGYSNDRQLPFHKRYDFLSVVGGSDSDGINAAVLKKFDYSVIAKVDFSLGMTLTVLATTDWASSVVTIKRCSTRLGTNSEVAAIALHVLETSMLFIGVLGDGSFVEVAHDETQGTPIRGLSLMNIAAVDPLQQYEHVVAVGASHLTDFREASPNIQFRSPSALLLRASPHDCVVSMPIANYQFSKCSDAVVRPVIHLEKVVVVPCSPNRQHQSKSQGNEPYCQLWANVAFDREDPLEPTSVILANALPDFYTLRSLYVVVPRLGTAVIPIAQCTHGTCIARADVYSDAICTAAIDVTLRCTFVEDQ